MLQLAALSYGTEKASIESSSIGQHDLNMLSNSRSDLPIPFGFVQTVWEVDLIFSVFPLTRTPDNSR